MAQERLNKSHYTTRADGTRMKSCPRCSVLSGDLVWYPEESFGDSTVVLCGEQRTWVQAWCPECRQASWKSKGWNDIGRWEEKR